MNAAMADALEDAGLSPLDISVFNVLVDAGAMSRLAIVNKLSIPWTTAYDALKKLKGMGLLDKKPFYEAKRSRGRPITVWFVLGRE